jgi:hypothetical protein
VKAETVTVRPVDYSLGFSAQVLDRPKSLQVILAEQYPPALSTNAFSLVTATTPWMMCRAVRDMTASGHPWNVTQACS